MYYFTADLHFNHTNIIKYCDRPFMTYEEAQQLKDAQFRDRSQVRKVFISKETTQRMNNAILNNINAKVGVKDTLIILGDFGFFHSSREAMQYRRSINCKNVILIKGNHDDDSKIAGVFEKCCDVLELTIRFDDKKKQKIWLSHYPHLSWAGKSHNSWHLFGHCHGTANQWISEHAPGMKAYDIGVDTNNFEPLSENEVRTIMETKSKLGSIGLSF